MNRIALISLMVSLVAVYPAAQAPATHNHDAAAGASAKATLADAQGRSLGTATLLDSPAGVLVKLELQNVPPGPHAFHIHAVGKCDAPDFASAGGHFNPTAKKHGLMAAGGPHAGDMPNLTVPANGRLSVDVLVPSVSIAAGTTSVFDADGSALMIHATGDDYATDPAGNAGGRIGCGVVLRGDGTKIGG